MERRSLTKAERHRLIASVIARRRIGTQMELIEALDKAGCQVTQATVSRDIRELAPREDPATRSDRLATSSRSGSRRDPHQSLASVLDQFGRAPPRPRTSSSSSSELGSAPAIARALDRLEHPTIVGTLAGDDTCLVIAAGPGRRDRRRARELTAAMSWG